MKNFLILKKLVLKLTYLLKPKCLNGIKELNIESDGRAILCQMGAKDSAALTKATIKDYGFDLGKFFDSDEVRSKRLNCQTCYLNCQQHIYFEPLADNPFKTLVRILKLPFTVQVRDGDSD